MIDLAAERAVLGALLTGALRPRDVDADLFGHAHHARLARLLLAFRAVRGPPPVAPVEEVCNRRRVWGFGFDVSADGTPRLVSLLDLARQAPRRPGALAAVAAMRRAAEHRYDVERDREAYVDAAAECVAAVLRNFTRDTRERRGLVISRAVYKDDADGYVRMIPGSADRNLTRPIEPEAMPDARALADAVMLRLRERGTFDRRVGSRPRKAIAATGKPKGPVMDPDLFVRTYGPAAVRCVVATAIPLDDFVAREDAFSPAP